MNIAQLSEQLKDVPQNRLIDYARNPNSVVPQFLALAEIQRRQHLSNQAQPAPATVAEDVLAQAAPQITPQMMAQQLPENQPGVAQLPTGMPQGMAAGGIVAFANGGDIGDEEDAVYDAEAEKIRNDENMMMSLLSKMKSRAGEIVSAIPTAARSIKDLLPESYEKAKAAVKDTASAAESGVEGFLSKIQHLESRGRHFDAKGNILTSPKGAEGIMQVMRKTQKDPGFGVTPARDRSPEELERVGRDYGIAMLREFGDPKLAAMAYNWGPANVKKWLASGQKTPVPEETRKYASNFSKGGIAAFAGPTGSLVEDEEDSYNPYAMFGDLGVSGSRYKEGFGIGDFFRRKLMGIKDVPVTGAPKPPSPQDWRDFDQASALFESEQRAKGPTAAPFSYAPQGGIGPSDAELGRTFEQAGPQRPSLEDEILARNLADRQELKKQAEEDKYMALIQAGLGMMSGSSPYALQNIGAGGMQGVSAYAAAKKQRAAEAAALGKEEREVMRMKDIKQYRGDVLAQEAELKKLGYSQREIEARLKDQDRNIQLANAYETKRRSEIENKYNKMTGWGVDPKLMEAYRAEIAALANDPKLQYLNRLAFPELEQFTQRSSSGTTSGSRPPLSSFNK